MANTNDFLSKPVVTLDEGKNCGIITNVLFDEKLAEAKGFTVFDREVMKYLTLGTDKIKKCGSDAIIIQSENDLTENIDDVAKKHYDVYDTRGKHLGLVYETEFDKNYKVKPRTTPHGTKVDHARCPRGVVAHIGGTQVLDGMDLGRIHDRLPVGAGHPDIEGGDGKIARQIPPGNVNAGQKF